MFIGFLWWRYCGHDYCAPLGEEIMVEWRKFGPKRPAAVCKPCQCNSRLEQAEIQWIYSRNSTNFSQSHSKNFKHYFGYCQQVYCMCGLQEHCVGYKNTVWVTRTLCELQEHCALNECRISLHPTRRRQDWKVINDYRCMTRVTVMITGLSQVVRVGCITTIQNQEASHLISSLHFFQKEKNIQGCTFCWKMHVHHCPRLKRYHSPGVRGQRC
jgi:hypothetical protein